jgi:hypothetical protein
VSNDISEAKAILATSRENIANATSVLVVGGGACGVGTLFLFYSLFFIKLFCRAGWGN